tara:strand:- start:14065 stop:14523 length:459 start_codon:yes stop_codon:yes gene_type:complete
MNISFKLALFKDRPAKIGRESEPPGLKRVQSEKVLLWLLQALVQANREELKTSRIDGKRIPKLYKAGVVYRRENNAEVWKDAINIYADGFGDCEDLACWRVAELQNAGKKARPYIRHHQNKETGFLLYHVLVQRANGKLEDPSAILGMKGPA